MEIVKQTTIRLNRNISIMDDKGTIIASGKAEHINQAHFGAIEVLKTGESFLINLNIGECAKRMLIFLNSPIYRIKRVKEITGHNPQDLNDLITW